jgi:hypothetical protein
MPLQFESCVNVKNRTKISRDPFFGPFIVLLRREEVSLFSNQHKN